MTSNVYSYVDAQTPQTALHTPRSTKKSNRTHSRRNFSLFVSPPLTSITPHGLSRTRTQGIYGGPIYTMSTPSPFSPTVYTGVVDGVVRLDFASTDDLTGPAKEWYDFNLSLDVVKCQTSGSAEQNQMFSLAGYEHPDPDDLTTTSKLRKQNLIWHPDAEKIRNEAITGWDRRWEPPERPGAWRRRDI